MTGKPEFFWSPPDGAPIVGVTTFEGVVVIATGSGIYVIAPGATYAPMEWTVHKITAAAASLPTVAVDSAEFRRLRSGFEADNLSPEDATLFRRSCPTALYLDLTRDILRRRENARK